MSSNVTRRRIRVFSALLTSSFHLLTSCFLLPTFFCVETAAAQPAAKVALASDFEVTPLADGVWMHTSWQEMAPYGRFPSHGLVVVDDGDALLIDTAWGDTLTTLLLNWITHDLHADVRRAVVTHSHDDRMGGIKTLKAAGIPTYAGRLTYAAAAERGLPLPDSVLAPLDHLEVGTRNVETFFPGGGHTPDNIVVWIPSENLLFGGCMIRPGKTASPGNTEDAALDDWPESVRKVLQRYPEARTVIPSHGAPGGKELLGHTISVIEAYNDRLRAEAAPPETISGQMQVNGATITYDVTGSGHPLVLIHGGFMDRRMWDDQLPAFAQRYKVIRVNLRGFQGQALPDARFSFVEDLNSFLTQLDTGPVYLLGLSLGAMVATEFALNHPDMVDALMLAGAPLRGLDAPDPEGSTEKMVAAIRTYRRGAVDSALALALELPVFNPAVTNMETQDRMEAMMRDNFGQWLKGSQLVDWDSVPPVDRVDAIKVPTLIVVGDHDVVSIQMASDSLAARIPRAEKLTIVGASHHVNMEAPDEFSRAVLGFLEKLD